MYLALLLARVPLVVVFSLAGLGKLADPIGSREAMTAFGVPAGLVKPAALFLPFLEIAVAIALLSAGGVRWGAVGALALLVLFIIAVGYNLALGRRPKCHCFGQIHSAPIGPGTLVRNIVLALVATFIIVEAGRHASPSAFALLGAITTSGRLILAIDLLLLALILIQAWFTLHLVRQNGRLITRLEAVEAPLGIDGRALVDEHAGLYVGTKAPDFALRSLDGGAVMTLSALCGHELPVLLIFGDPDCGPCAQLMPEIVNWQRNYSDKITIALLATGSEEANRAKNAEHGLRNILLEGDSNISESYQVNGTPAAMVVGKDGRVAGRLVLGPGRIRPLFERTVGLAPAIQLPVQGPTTPTTKTSSHLQAISVRGPFHGVTGYDHHVREFVRELHRQGIAVELQDLASWHPARLPDAMRDPWFDSLQQDVGARVALHFCMPHQVIRDRTKANVNYTMFEADRVPVSWIQPSRGDDFVIVPTDSSRRAWIASGQREQQLRECPLGIDASLYSAVHEPMNLTLPDGSDIGRFRTRFLNVSEWIPRKNVDGLLRSWMKATTAKDDAVLIVKLSRNGPLRDMFPSWLASFEQHAGGAMSSAAPIHFVETTLSDHDMPRLYATATHYISMSFGEGWDQAMFEAAASGLELIAPEHTAYRHYLDDSVAHLIPAREEPVKYWGDPATAALFEGANWWAPDENVAAQYIRSAIDGHGAQKQSAKSRILTDFTWRTATERLIEILSEAQETRWRRWVSLTLP